jgi:hypothetical protein
MGRWKHDPQAARDAATLLPIVATVLLLPPIILVFAAPVLVAGIPLIVIYVFSVWALIVFGAWLIASRQAHEPDVAHTSIEGEADRP